MELVTGRKGSAHITSQQDRMKHQGIWGSGAYILQTGQMLEPQVQSSNEIRIQDGALMVQGALGCVKVNTYDPVTIQNGTQGMKRIDLICWQYSYDAEQDVESAEWVVIQGTPAESDPQQPSYTDGDIQLGDSLVQVPAFAVELDGINVTGVTTLLQTAPTLEELNSNLKNTLNPTNVEYLDPRDVNTSFVASSVIFTKKYGKFVNLCGFVNIKSNLSGTSNSIFRVNSEAAAKIKTGERVWIPLSGAGAASYLFINYTDPTLVMADGLASGIHVFNVWYEII